VLPFAAPLKRMLASLGVDDRHLYGSPEDKMQPLDLLCGRSARAALQYLGTEWGRNLIGDDLWLNAWRHALDTECDSDDVIVADDVRFSNEAEAIEQRGGLLLCIVRSRDDFARIPKHASEDFAALGPFNDIIVNDRSLFALERRLDCVIDAATPSQARRRA
jgi:hypothetical protein